MYTTLYDLIAAVDEAIEPGEEDLVAPIVAHVLRAGRAHFLRDVDVEMFWDDQDRVSGSRGKLCAGVGREARMRPSILTEQGLVHQPATGLLVTRQTSPHGGVTRSIHPCRFSGAVPDPLWITLLHGPGLYTIRSRSSPLSAPLSSALR